MTPKLGARCAAILAAGVMTGCAAGAYRASAHAAAIRLEEAKAAGAEQLAPLEYYRAKDEYQRAELEARGASYSEARAHARNAEKLASKATQLALGARVGGP